jgi:polyisoprenoid-binding protein YceI
MALLPKRLKTKRGALLAIGGSLVVAAGALALAYFLLFPTSSPKRFALTTPAASASSAASTPIGSSTQLAGHWKIASGSAAGYRVREKLGFLPAQSDAVGRTSAITGDASFTKSKHAVTVTAASFTVDVSKLTSDRSMRDQRIHTIGLQSDQYPTATFVLSSSLTLPASALTGQVTSASATGVFNIHGTSKRETVPLQMRMSTSSIEVVGSITFPWSEFNMTAPSIGGFVNVTDKATMEFDLHLQHA